LTYQWHDLVGNAGVVCILAAYLLLQLNRLDSASLKFSLVNGAGAAMILISLVHDFNLSAVVIEVFWLAISLLGVVRGLRNRHR
jgi:hypothetical protein